MGLIKFLLFHNKKKSALALRRYGKTEQIKKFSENK